MLSVALCTYNGEKYIREQIESILNQTVPVDEIIVSDDGSTDSTLNILSEYTKSNHPIIQVLQNEYTLGVRANFQSAVNHCHGDIIFFSDQDDIWLPNKVAETVNYLFQNSNICVAFSNGNLIDSNGQIIPSNDLWGLFFDSYYKMLFDNHFELECFLDENHATGAAMAARGDFLRNNSFSNATSERILHDHIIAIKAIEQNALGYIDKHLIQYRLHSRQQRGAPPIESKITRKSSIPLAFYPAQYMVDVLTNPYYIERASFLSYRLRLKHQILGPLSILKNFSKYRHFYNSSCLKVMAADTFVSIGHTLTRIKNKLFHS